MDGQADIKMVDYSAPTCDAVRGKKLLKANSKLSGC